MTTEPSRFITGPSLDDVVAKFMTPVMKEAGFAQRKTRFQKRGANDATVSVQVKIGARNNALLTFGILWSAVPPALAAF